MLPLGEIEESAAYTIKSLFFFDAGGQVHVVSGPDVWFVFKDYSAAYQAVKLLNIGFCAGALR